MGGAVSLFIEELEGFANELETHLARTYDRTLARLPANSRQKLATALGFSTASSTITTPPLGAFGAASSTSTSTTPPTGAFKAPSSPSKVTAPRVQTPPMV